MATLRLIDITLTFFTLITPRKIGDARYKNATPDRLLRGIFYSGAMGTIIISGVDT